MQWSLGEHPPEQADSVGQPRQLADDLGAAHIQLYYYDTFWHLNKYSYVSLSIYGYIYRHVCVHMCVY